MMPQMKIPAVMAVYDPRPEPGGASPSTYFAIMLGSLCFAGFILSCIGVEGSGNGWLFFGGWFITVGAGGALLALWFF